MIEKVFLLRAHAQSGKDTCALLMKEEYEKKGKRVIIIGFGDYVKFTLSRYYGVEDFKSKVGRTVIQHYATEQVRGYDPTFWGRTVADLVAAIQDDFDIVIVPDWRFRNEYEAMAARFDFEEIKTILITRPDYQLTDNMTEAQRAHSSESELDSYTDYDYTIVNENGQLGHTAAQLFEMIEKESSDGAV